MNQPLVDKLTELKNAEAAKYDELIALASQDGPSESEQVSQLQEKLAASESAKAELASAAEALKAVEDNEDSEQNAIISALQEYKARVQAAANSL